LFHAPSVVGMARSCGWLSMYVGLDWITDRAQGLARGALDLLAATPGVEVLTPPRRLATLVAFRIAGWPAGDALDELGRRTFAIARHVAPLDAIRISTAFFNTEAEIARFCAAVAEIAAHTPETLPRRPALTILGQE
jgi:L-cysteine/cystine lyase